MFVAAVVVAAAALLLLLLMLLLLLSLFGIFFLLQLFLLDLVQLTMTSERIVEM